MLQVSRSSIDLYQGIPVYGKIIYDRGQTVRCILNRLCGRNEFRDATGYGQCILQSPQRFRRRIHFLRVAFDSRLCQEFQGYGAQPLCFPRRCP